MKIEALQAQLDEARHRRLTMTDYEQLERVNQQIEELEKWIAWEHPGTAKLVGVKSDEEA